MCCVESLRALWRVARKSVGIAVIVDGKRAARGRAAARAVAKLVVREHHDDGNGPIAEAREAARAGGATGRGREQGPRNALWNRWPVDTKPLPLAGGQRPQRQGTRLGVVQVAVGPHPLQGCAYRVDVRRHVHQVAEQMVVAVPVSAVGDLAEVPCADPRASDHAADRAHDAVVLELVVRQSISVDVGAVRRHTAQAVVEVAGGQACDEPVALVAHRGAHVEQEVHIRVANLIAKPQLSKTRVARAELEEDRRVVVARQVGARRKGVEVVVDPVTVGVRRAAKGAPARQAAQDNLCARVSTRTADAGIAGGQGDATTVRHLHAAVDTGERVLDDEAVDPTGIAGLGRLRVVDCGRFQRTIIRSIGEDILATAVDAVPAVARAFATNECAALALFRQFEARLWGLCRVTRTAALLARTLAALVGDRRVTVIAVAAEGAVPPVAVAIAINTRGSARVLAIGRSWVSVPFRATGR